MLGVSEPNPKDSSPTETLISPSHLFVEMKSGDHTPFAPECIQEHSVIASWNNLSVGQLVGGLLANKEIVFEEIDDFKQFSEYFFNDFF